MNCVTSYGKIRSFAPCKVAWKKLLKGTNPERKMDKQISLLEILDSNGVEDAIWALQCWSFPEYHLLIVDILRRILLPYWTAVYPEDDRLASAIQAIEDRFAGRISNLKMHAISDKVVEAANLAASHEEVKTANAVIAANTFDTNAAVFTPAVIAAAVANAVCESAVAAACAKMSPKIEHHCSCIALSDVFNAIRHIEVSTGDETTTRMRIESLMRIFLNKEEK